MDYEWIFADIAVMILVLLAMYSQEHFDSYDPKDTDNYIRLYETFTYVLTHQMLAGGSSLLMVRHVSKLRLRCN